MASTPAAQQLARVFVASDVSQSAFVVDPLEWRPKGSDCDAPEERVKAAGSGGQGSQRGEPRWPLCRVAVATGCPAVNEAGVSRWLRMLICVSTLTDFIFVSGGDNEMFAGRLQNQTCGSLLEFGAIAEVRLSDRTAKLKIKSAWSSEKGCLRAVCEGNVSLFTL